MDNIMQFPETFEEFAKSYGFKDSKEIYTNGSELIPVFRVEQWLEHARVERTCRLVEKTWDDGFEKDMWGVECDACGRRYPYEDGEGIYFCQNCGAEVMEE